MSGSMIPMIDNLSTIRMDESFRLSFLFKENAEHFIKTFGDCRSQMFQFLSDLEDSAFKLDRMKKGSSISSVAGSSVGIVGGVMSIIGLGLAPFTAGLSLGLTMTGLGLGVASGVNSVVTGVTEIAVNKHHEDKANDIFQKFMKDVQNVIDCLDKASSQCPVLNMDGPKVAFTAVKTTCMSGTVVQNIVSLRNNYSAVKVLRNEEVAWKAVSWGLQESNAGRNIPKFAADLPNIKKLAVGTPLAYSKTLRAGLVGLNVFFIGVDIFSICSESKSLAKGEKCEMSKILRSRSSLWRTEMNNWNKMYDCLLRAKINFEDPKHSRPTTGFGLI